METTNINNDEIELDAVVANVPVLAEFIEAKLEQINCPVKAMMQISVAVDELFSNISMYAYGEQTGKAIIKITLDNSMVSISFTDSGIPYNPLEKEDPDVEAPIEERKIGGLGIYMVKKTMDDMIYEYTDGHNILTIKKNI